MASDKGWDRLGSESTIRSEIVMVRWCGQSISNTAGLAPGAPQLAQTSQSVHADPDPSTKELTMVNQSCIMEQRKKVAWSSIQASGVNVTLWDMICKE